MSIKTIACLGDSHTWGQGVRAGLNFNPPFVSGEKRMLSFKFPFYVNLIRNEINKLTGSFADEFITDKLFKLCADNRDDFGIFTIDNPVVLEEDFDLVRVFLKATKDKPSNIIVYIDDKEYDSFLLDTIDDSFAFSVKPYSYLLENTAHKLKITTDRYAEIHRIEIYRGNYAVVNCGVGSCAVKSYVDNYLDSYVKIISPYMVVFEGCTINDWLQDNSPIDYLSALIEMDKRILETSEIFIPHATFPINKTADTDVAYDEFESVLINHYIRTDLPFINIKEKFLDVFEKENIDTRVEKYYDDRWHPSAYGHKLYADNIIPEIVKRI